MRITPAEQNFFYDKVAIALYKWRLHLVQQEIDSDFKILRSMQNPFTDFNVKKISQMDVHVQKETLTAFVKRFYDHNLFPELKISDYEQSLIDDILNPPQPAIYPECFCDMEKYVEYEQKKILYGEKIYRQKLFNRLKKKVKQDLNVSFEVSGNDFLEFNTDIRKGLKINTMFFSDTRDYSYCHNLYVDSELVMLRWDHANLLGFPSKWLIHQEEDIEIALDNIFGFCQEFFESAGKIISGLNLNK
jgi:hypothetical protein